MVGHLYAAMLAWHQARMSATNSGLVGGNALARHDAGLDRLAAPGVGRGDDADLGDGRMAQHQGLDFRRPDLETRSVDHALDAVDEEEITLFVVGSEIAGVQKRLAVLLEQRSGRALRIVPVALEQLRGGDDDLADLAGGRSSPVSTLTTRLSTSKTGMPRHCRFGRSVGLICVAAMVSDMPYPST